MSHLERAMVDGGVDTRDARGLMPLPEARRRLARRRVFARGDEERIGDLRVLGGDRLWAALLSLADAAEFVRVASRLRWDHPPRGRDNAAPHERYGDAILPWLAGALGADGRFPPNLWCAAPCLLRIGGADALALARRVKRAGFVEEWLGAHPEGFGLLAGQAEAGDEEARRALVGVATEDPVQVRAALGAARADGLGLPAVDPEIEAALTGVAPRPIPEARPVTMGRVAALVRNFELPMWDNANSFTGAMRVTGFASPVADALLFQSLVTGLGMGNVRWELVRVDADGLRRVREVELVPEGALYRWDGGAVQCVPTGVRREAGTFSAPAGPGTVRVDAVGAEVPCRIDTAGMAPPVAAVFEGRSPEEGLVTRLGQDHRERLFLAGDALREAAGLDASAEALFSFDGFQLPLAGQPATAAPDLVALVAALRRRLPIARLPVGGHPLGNLYDRLVVPALRWGDPRFLTG
jgi:hypothetical protein